MNYRKLAVRDAVCVMMQCLAGFRIGEASEGGQGQGVLANMIEIYAACIEFVLNSRKTSKHPIRITVARHTKGNGFDLGALLLEFFRLWKVPTQVFNEGTAEEHIKPVYFVTRLSLAVFHQEDFPAVSAAEAKEGVQPSRLELCA